MPSNIITPPDFLENENPNTLIIDASISDVENLALFLQTSFKHYNIYLYRDVMLEEVWLEKSWSLAHAIIINTQDSECNIYKNRMINDARTWYYGPKNYLGNQQKLTAPIDYFIKHQ